VTIWYYHITAKQGGNENMNCPYCGKPVEEGTLMGSTKTGLRFQTHTDARKNRMDRFLDSLGGKGLLKGEGAFAGYRIPAAYCKNCEKMILNTKLQQKGCEKNALDDSRNHFADPEKRCRQCGRSFSVHVYGRRHGP
jgi:hypothetical protein